MSLCASGVNDYQVDHAGICGQCGWDGETEAVYDSCCRTTYWTCPGCGAEHKEAECL